jgi:hypothetical protein
VALHAPVVHVTLAGGFDRSAPLAFDDATVMSAGQINCLEVVVIVTSVPGEPDVLSGAW